MIRIKLAKYLRHVWVYLSWILTGMLFMLPAACLHYLSAYFWAHTRLFSLSFRCFPSSHANSWPASRTPAGTRNTLGMSLQIPTGQTCTHITRSAFARCSSIWGALFENTWSTKMEKHTACGAFRIFISSVNQSVARRTCTTDWGCTLMLNSPLSKSHTGGHARGLVSQENSHLQFWKHKQEHLSFKTWVTIYGSFAVITPPSLNTDAGASIATGLISSLAEWCQLSFAPLWSVTQIHHMAAATWKERAPSEASPCALNPQAWVFPVLE